MRFRSPNETTSGTWVEDLSSPRLSGMSGGPAEGKGKLANVWDLSADYKIAPRFGATFYYAKAWGSSVIKHIYPNRSNGQFGYVEFNTSF